MLCNNFWWGFCLVFLCGENRTPFTLKFLLSNLLTWTSHQEKNQCNLYLDEAQIKEIIESKKQSTDTSDGFRMTHAYGIFDSPIFILHLYKIYIDTQNEAEHTVVK